MLFKGKVESIIDEYTVKVRIPLLHKIPAAANYTPTDMLPTAQICTLANTRPNIALGDTVIVGFENNDLSKPIILGYLFSDIDSNTACSPIFNTLEVQYSTHLSADTSIGRVTPQNIDSLRGMDESIYYKFKELEAEIQQLKAKVFPES